MGADERRQLKVCQAQTTHAGLDFEMDRVGGLARCRGLSQRREYGRIAHHRSELVGEEITELLLEDRSEDDDRHNDAGLPKRDPFFRREDGQACDTMPNQCPRRFDRAMTIGVGLDHRHDVTPRGHDSTKLGEIVRERRQIYGGDGWGEGWRTRHATKRESGSQTQTSMISCSFFLITSSIF